MNCFASLPGLKDAPLWLPARIAVVQNVCDRGIHS